MSIIFEDRTVDVPSIDVKNGSTVKLKCTAVSNPEAMFSWNLNINSASTLIIEEIQSPITVNCTARNTMISASGHIVYGFNSLNKDIRILSKYKTSSSLNFFQNDGLTGRHLI